MPLTRSSQPRKKQGHSRKDRPPPPPPGTARAVGDQRREITCRSHTASQASLSAVHHSYTQALSPGSSPPTTAVLRPEGQGPSLYQGSDYQGLRNPRPCRCWFSLVWFPEAWWGGGCWEAGKGASSPDHRPPSSPKLPLLPPTAQGQREDSEEAGVPRLPPTAPGSAHMAKSHGFCPAHETHLTQNLFQLLQFSLAAVEASLSDASTSHTPPEEGEGAHTNNGALWHPPPETPRP